MDTNSEIIDKLKESVIAKLDELESNKNHDSTLIDYILVMVVNHKSKYEMKHNLALFLGKIVDDFVNWLFDYLIQLQITNSNQDKTKITENKNLSNQNKAKEPVVKNETTKDSSVDTMTSATENNVVNLKRKIKSAVISKGTEKLNKEDNKAEDNNKEFTKSKKRLLVNEFEGLHKSKKRSFKENSNFNKNEQSNTEDVSKSNEKENETKFLVTLDGVKDMFKDNDLFLLDEDFDPELMKEDLTNFDQRSNKQNLDTQENQSSKISERCKYWPSCMNGPKCEFFHPITKCNLFPYCRFGDKCLYVHPTCKFDSLCSRKDCPFMHTSKRNQLNSTVTCKYYPNCAKQFCEFFHPKTCHYGATCKSFNCPYIHPTTQNIPPPSKLKWSSKNTSNLPVINNEEIEIK